MSRLLGCFAVLGRRIQICHAFLRLGVVDAQELVGTGCHVGIIRLALRALLIEELVYGFILRCQAQIDRHDLKQCLAQMWGTAFRSCHAVADTLAGVIDGLGNTGKADEGAAAGKVANIADLCYKLRGRCVAHAIHGTNSFVLRQFPCKTSHLTAYNSNQFVHRGQLLGQSQILCKR